MVLRRYAEAQGYTVCAPTHAECPLEETERVSDTVLTAGASLVINAAAISGLESCMDNPLQAHSVNAMAPAAMALACRHTGARFLHLSTDYVLDGRRAGLKDETARCKPVNTYAESKREAEFAITEAYAESIIARVSWICGNPARPSFIEQTLTRARQALPLAAIADKFSLPTHADDLARNALALAEGDYCGVIHLCAGGSPLSWYDCAAIALDEAVGQGLLDTVPPLTRQSLKEAVFFRALRPQHTAMANARLLSLGLSMPVAEEAIRQAVSAYRAHTTQRG